MMEDILQLFDTLPPLPVEFIPRSHPDSGTRYVYSWTEETKKGTLYLHNVFKSKFNLHFFHISGRLITFLHD